MRTLYYGPVIPIFFCLSFPRLISAVADWMSTILRHIMWPYCEFRMHVWNLCCTRLAGNTGRKNHRHLRTIAQLCRAISSQLRHIYRQSEKSVKHQYLPHMLLQYCELRPTNSWDLLASLGHPSKFQRVSRLGSVTARHSGSGRQPNFVALNRGCHLYLAGRPSRWALAHISSYWMFLCLVFVKD